MEIACISIAESMLVHGLSHLFFYTTLCLTSCIQLFLALAPDITQAILSTGSIVAIVVSALVGILVVIILVCILLC